MVLSSSKKQNSSPKKGTAKHSANSSNSADPVRGANGNGSGRLPLSSNGETLEHRLHSFIQSLHGFLGEVGTLEVSTMVVEHISGAQFIPWNSYTAIYGLTSESLHSLDIHPSLQPHYLELHETLERSYISLLGDSTSECHDLQLLAQAQMPGPKGDRRSILPDPQDPKSQLQLQRLLRSFPFLCTLRKVTELKYSLDQRQQRLLVDPSASPTHLWDTVYAQTLLQLNGTIQNRYLEQVIEHPQRDVLVNLHQQGVMAGQQQWRGVAAFMMEVLNKALQLKL